MEFKTKEEVFDAFMRHKISIGEAIEALKSFMSNDDAVTLVKAWRS